MKFTTLSISTALILGFMLSSGGCSHYQITFNEQIIHRPPAIFKDYALTDTALQTCVEQTLIDQTVIHPEQLDRLVCTDAGIRSLEGLSLFSQISTLNLSNNDLGKIDALFFLVQLHDLNLAGNTELDCNAATKLRQHIQGQLLLPEHCQ